METISAEGLAPVPTESCRAELGSGAENRTFSASLSASYEIDFWGKNRAALRAAEETAVASRYEREVVTLSTVAAAANAYFQVLAAQDRLRTARESTRDSMSLPTWVRSCAVMVWSTRSMSWSMIGPSSRSDVT